MGHILKPYKGGRDDHKDQAADQKKAAFEWAEISKLLDKYQLWPAKWTSIIKTAIGQKTLGRMATPAKGQSLPALPCTRGETLSSRLLGMKMMN
jgi:hypothetical protein